MPDKVRIILVWHGGKMIEKSNITKRASKFAPACYVINIRQIVWAITDLLTCELCCIKRREIIGLPPAKAFELLKTRKCKAFVKYGYKSFYSCINNRIVVQFQMIWFCMIICGKFFGERYDKSNNIR